MYHRPCHFYYNISGERAQELLFRHGMRGEFLVRPSESNRIDYTISVHRGERVTHVKIVNNDGVLAIPTGDKFETLSDVVSHLVEIQCELLEMDGSVIEMRTPCLIPKDEIPVNGGRDRFFYVNISAIEAESFLKDEPVNSYLLRESGSVPGEYVLCVKVETTILHIKIHFYNGRFRVDRSADSFRTITELLDNYTRVPMMQTNGAPINLGSFLPSTRFPAFLIEDRIESLKRMARKGSDKDGISDEFDRLQQPTEEALFISCKVGKTPENYDKNRYRNIVPYDHTRIKLDMEGNPNASDYINANRVEVLSDDPKYADFRFLKRRYISTQGCTENTVGDFWRMMWQENSQVIVMITKEHERGRTKCARYWPDPSGTLTTGIKDELVIVNIEEENHSDYIRRVFHLSKQLPDSENRLGPRKIFQYQFLMWADYETPADSVQALMEEVNRCSEHDVSPNTGPMVVHCSAGIGRTGTYIAIDILMHLIKRMGGHHPIDIIKTVKMLREQRDMMVQTEAQYRFIYEAIASYIKSCRMSDEERVRLNRERNDVKTTNSSPIRQFQNMNLNGHNSSDELYLNTTPSPSSKTFNLSPSKSSPRSHNHAYVEKPEPPLVLAPPPRPKKNLQPKQERKNKEDGCPAPEQHQAYMNSNDP